MFNMKNSSKATKICSAMNLLASCFLFLVVLLLALPLASIFDVGVIMVVDATTTQTCAAHGGTAMVFSKTATPKQCNPSASGYDIDSDGGQIIIGNMDGCSLTISDCTLLKLEFSAAVTGGSVVVKDTTFLSTTQIAARSNKISPGSPKIEFKGRLTNLQKIELKNLKWIGEQIPDNDKTARHFIEFRGGIDGISDYMEVSNNQFDVLIPTWNSPTTSWSVLFVDFNNDKGFFNNVKKFNFHDNDMTVTVKSVAAGQLATRMLHFGTDPSGGPGESTTSSSLLNDPDYPQLLFTNNQFTISSNTVQGLLPGNGGSLLFIENTMANFKLVSILGNSHSVRLKATEETSFAASQVVQIWSFALGKGVRDCKQVFVQENSVSVSGFTSAGGASGKTLETGGRALSILLFGTLASSAPTKFLNIENFKFQRNSLAGSVDTKGTLQSGVALLQMGGNPFENIHYVSIDENRFDDFSITASKSFEAFLANILPDSTLALDTTSAKFRFREMFVRNNIIRIDKLEASYYQARASFMLIRFAQKATFPNMKSVLMNNNSITINSWSGFGGTLFAFWLDATSPSYGIAFQSATSSQNEFRVVNSSMRIKNFKTRLGGGGSGFYVILFANDGSFDFKSCNTVEFRNLTQIVESLTTFAPTGTSVARRFALSAIYLSYPTIFGNVYPQNFNVKDIRVFLRGPVDFSAAGAVAPNSVRVVAALFLKEMQSVSCPLIFDNVQAQFGVAPEDGSAIDDFPLPSTFPVFGSDYLFVTRNLQINALLLPSITFADAVAPSTVKPGLSVTNIHVSVRVKNLTVISPSGYGNGGYPLIVVPIFFRLPSGDSAMLKSVSSSSPSVKSVTGIIFDKCTVFLGNINKISGSSLQDGQMLVRGLSILGRGRTVSGIDLGSSCSAPLSITRFSITFARGSSSSSSQEDYNLIPLYPQVEGGVIVIAGVFVDGIKSGISSVVVQNISLNFNEVTMENIPSSSSSPSSAFSQMFIVAVQFSNPASATSTTNRGGLTNIASFDANDIVVTFAASSKVKAGLNGRSQLVLASLLLSSMQGVRESVNIQNIELRFLSNNDNNNNNNQVEITTTTDGGVADPDKSFIRRIMSISAVLFNGGTDSAGTKIVQVGGSVVLRDIAVSCLNLAGGGSGSSSSTSSCLIQSDLMSASVAAVSNRYSFDDVTVMNSGQLVETPAASGGNIDGVFGSVVLENISLNLASLNNNNNNKYPSGALISSSGPTSTKVLITGNSIPQASVSSLLNSRILLLGTVLLGNITQVTGSLQINKLSLLVGEYDSSSSSSSMSTIQNRFYYSSSSFTPRSAVWVCLFSADNIDTIKETLSFSEIRLLVNSDKIYSHTHLYFSLFRVWTLRKLGGSLLFSSLIENVRASEICGALQAEVTTSRDPKATPAVTFASIFVGATVEFTGSSSSSQRDLNVQNLHVSLPNITAAYARGGSDNKELHAAVLTTLLFFGNGDISGGRNIQVENSHLLVSGFFCADTVVATIFFLSDHAAGCTLFSAPITGSGLKQNRDCHPTAPYRQISVSGIFLVRNTPLVIANGLRSVQTLRTAIVWVDASLTSQTEVSVQNSSLLVESLLMPVTETEDTAPIPFSNSDSTNSVNANRPFSCNILKTLSSASSSTARYFWSLSSIVFVHAHISSPSVFVKDSAIRNSAFLYSQYALETLGLQLQTRIYLFTPSYALTSVVRPFTFDNVLVEKNSMFLQLPRFSKSSSVDVRVRVRCFANDIDVAKFSSSSSSSFSMIFSENVITAETLPFPFSSSSEIFITPDVVLRLFMFLVDFSVREDTGRLDQLLVARSSSSSSSSSVPHLLVNASNNVIRPLSFDLCTALRQCSIVFFAAQLGFSGRLNIVNNSFPVENFVSDPAALAKNLTPRISLLVISNSFAYRAATVYFAKNRLKSGRLIDSFPIDGSSEGSRFNNTNGTVIQVGCQDSRSFELYRYLARLYNGTPAQAILSPPVTTTILVTSSGPGGEKNKQQDDGDIVSFLCPPETGTREQTVSPSLLTISSSTSKGVTNTENITASRSAESHSFTSSNASSESLEQSSTVTLTRTISQTVHLEITVRNPPSVPEGLRSTQTVASVMSGAAHLASAANKINALQQLATCGAKDEYGRPEPPAPLGWDQNPFLLTFGTDGYRYARGGIVSCVSLICILFLLHFVVVWFRYVKGKNKYKAKYGDPSEEEEQEQESGDGDGEEKNTKKKKKKKIKEFTLLKAFKKARFPGYSAVFLQVSVAPIAASTSTLAAAFSHTQNGLDIILIILGVLFCLVIPVSWFAWIAYTGGREEMKIVFLNEEKEKDDDEEEQEGEFDDEEEMLAAPLTNNNNNSNESENSKKKKKKKHRHHHEEDEEDEENEKEDDNNSARARVCAVWSYLADPIAVWPKKTRLYKMHAPAYESFTSLWFVLVEHFSVLFIGGANGFSQTCTAAPNENVTRCCVRSLSFSLAAAVFHSLVVFYYRLPYTTRTEKVANSGVSFLTSALSIVIMAQYISKDSSETQIQSGPVDIITNITFAFCMLAVFVALLYGVFIPMATAIKQYSEKKEEDDEEAEDEDEEEQDADERDDAEEEQEQEDRQRRDDKSSHSRRHHRRHRHQNDSDDREEADDDDDRHKRHRHHHRHHRRSGKHDRQHEEPLLSSSSPQVTTAPSASAAAAAAAGGGDETRSPSKQQQQSNTQNLQDLFSPRSSNPSHHHHHHQQNDSILPSPNNNNNLSSNNLNNHNNNNNASNNNFSQNSFIAAHTIPVHQQAETQQYLFQQQQQQQQLQQQQKLQNQYREQHKQQQKQQQEQREQEIKQERIEIAKQREEEKQQENRRQQQNYKKMPSKELVRYQQQLESQLKRLEQNTKNQDGDDESRMLYEMMKQRAENAKKALEEREKL